MTTLSPAMDGGRILVVRLERLQQRYWFVTFCGSGIAAATAVLGVALTALIVRGHAAPRLTLFAAAAGMIAAVTVAFARTPGLPRIARLADARLSLENRTATALQYAHDADAVAQLIVRDATDRLALAAVNDVFPFEVPRLTPWVAATTVALSLVWIAAERAPRPGTMRTPPTLSIGGPAGAAGASGSKVSAPSVPPASDGRRDSSGGAAPFSGNEPSSMSAADTARLPPATAMARPALTERSAGSGKTAAEDARDSKASPRGGAAASGGTAAQGVSGSGASVSRNAETFVREPVGSTRPNAIDARSGNEPPTSGGMNRRNAGGGRRTPARPRAGFRGDAALYAEARGRAERAIEGERIPAGLRHYLKAYFTAVAPH